METTVTPLAIDGTAADDLELSRALLDRVAAGEVDAALRIWRPVPAVSFSKLDLLLSPGSGAAVALAEEAGLEAIQRMSGGHAVVLGEGSLCVGLAEPAAAFEDTQARYERMSAAIIGALAELAVEAEPGELPGEWCPGAWSIHAGPVKLAGLSQRVIKGAAWSEAVLHIGEPDRVLFAAVYEALELPLDPATLGAAGVEFEALAGPVAARLALPGAP